jgi:inner membrane protein
VDNLTHALAGMLLAEAVVQIRARASRGAPSAARRPAKVLERDATDAALSHGWRSVAYVVSVAGNNAPDLDFLWSGVTARPFGYLLHHRGYSHALPGAMLCALLLAAGVIAWQRWRRFAWSRADFAFLFFLCVAGPIVHIAMDSSNNYGTHPFWPLYRGWIYGDAMFIVEPLFWAAGVPPLIFAARSAITRWTLGAILVGGVALACVVPFVPTPMAALLAVVSLTSCGAAYRAAPAVRVGLGVIGCLAVAATFFAAAHLARTAVRVAVNDEAALLDVVVTPMPVNPFCFTALTVERRGDVYRARRATVATVPSLFSMQRCPDPGEMPTARFAPSTLADTAAVHFRGEYTASVASLVDLHRDNCQAAALLRFLRVPYWTDAASGTLTMGDLRYDRNPGRDFSDAEIEVHPTSCPRAVPSWTPPRRDILGAD